MLSRLLTLTSKKIHLDPSSTVDRHSYLINQCVTEMARA